MGSLEELGITDSASGIMDSDPAETEDGDGEETGQS